MGHNLNMLHHEEHPGERCNGIMNAYATSNGKGWTTCNLKDLQQANLDCLTPNGGIIL